MFRRLLWLVIGAGFGFGVSFWLMRFVKETAERYRPERISEDLTGAIRSLGSDIRAAVADGRVAMREREEEVRSSIEARNLTGARAGRP